MNFTRKSFVFTLGILGAVTSLILPFHNEFIAKGLNRTAENKIYSMLLDNTNGALSNTSYAEGSTIVKTNDKSNTKGIKFEYIYASKSQDESNHPNLFCQLKSDKGILKNADAIHGLTKIKVNYSSGGSRKMKITLLDGYNGNDVTTKEITSGVDVTLDGTKDYFKLHGGNAYYVTSIYLEYKCLATTIPEEGSSNSSSTSSSRPSSSEETLTSKTLELSNNVGKIDGGYNKSVEEFTSEGVTYKKYYLMNLSGGFGQFKKAEGYLYNTTSLTNIESIKVTFGPSSTTAMALSYGTSANPSNKAITLESGKLAQIPSGNGFFKLETSENYAEVKSIFITYKGTIVPSNPDQGGGSDQGGDQGQGGGGESTNPSSGKLAKSTPIEGLYNVPTSPLTGYYSSIDYTSRKTKLLSDVRDLIVSTHNKYTSYNNCTGKDNGGYYHQTDADPDNPNNLVMLYTHASINESWNNGKVYNREHVWPKSLSSDLWGTSCGGSDIHHVRPDFNATNGERSSKLFGDLNKKGLYQYTYGGETYDAAYTSGNVWEPLDFAKGDVARIVLYTFIHYNSPSALEKVDNLDGPITSTANASGQTSGNVTLPLTNVVSGSLQSAINLMIKWNKLDPVDNLEMNRNNAAYKIQGNRNPFIDHPWMVEAIWGNLA